MGAQWLSGIVLDARRRGGGFKPHMRHCVVSLSRSLVLVQPRKTRPDITVCLFGLVLYIPVNNFSVMLGQVFLG